jgi:DNA ligase-1
MARKPLSRYEAGRSNTLLKVKTFKDAEARVIGHVAGAGRHKGRLGALLVELADGTRFHVGTGFSDHEREDPPPAGALVTFRYQELSDQGVPRFPSFVAVRDDVKGPSRLEPEKKTPPTPAPRKAPPAASIGRRRFEMQDGDTRYFWEIERDGAMHRVRFGTFEAKVKRFESGEEAESVLAARIQEKLQKGFVEVDD